MTPKKPVPARLFVLLAREAPVGVILRRGPSNWVQMIHWDTKNDVFTPGQWFKGRIKELTCDLSPDGNLFIYFALKGRKWVEGYTNSWIAVSKPPYFTALALWPVGDDYGGGRFLDNRTVWLTVHSESDPAKDFHPDHPPHNLTALNAIKNDLRSYNDRGLQAYQYNRSGWLQSRLEYSNEGMWQKAVPPFILAMIRGIPRHPVPRNRADEYMLSDSRTGRQFQLDKVLWADFDQQRRLVLAKEGKLFAATAQNGELTLTELADFNANQPESIETPDWAKTW